MTTTTAAGRWPVSSHQPQAPGRPTRPAAARNASCGGNAMTAHLHCDGCGVRFGKRARPLLMFSMFVLCPGCEDSIAIHAVLFRGCPQQHPCSQHGAGGDHCTVGRCREALATTQFG